MKNRIARRTYFKLVRALERARARCVGDWAAAVIRGTTTRQRRAILAALEDGFGPLKVTVTSN